MSQFPRLGLGGAGLGNLYRAIDDSGASAAVHAALGGGFGLIDTAPYYGHGLSETRIGAALRSWRGARPMLSTKVGRVLDPAADPGDFGFADPMPFRPRFNYSRDGVRRSLEESLTRLGVERINVALVHDVGRVTHGYDHARVLKLVLDEALPALADARAEGLLSNIGLGVNEWEVCVEILDRTPLDVILLAGRYTLLEQPALTSGMLDRCLHAGTRMIAAGVFNSGLLATRPSADSTYNYAAAPPEVIDRACALWDLCERFDVPPQTAALQFPLAHPAVATVIVGARSVGEVEDTTRWLQTPVPDELWAALKEEQFLAPDAPVPADR